MSGLFGGGGGNSAQQEVYAGVQVSTSLYGACIPYLAGRQRIPQNLLWYGNFKVTTSNSGGGKGGGGNGTKQYSYSAAWIGGLCIGPIQGITNVWHDKALVNLTSENLALSEGGASFVASITTTTMTVTKMNGGFIGVGSIISGPGVTAGTTVSAGPGGVGSYTISPSQTVGSNTLRASQLTWTGYPAGTPAGQKIPYDSTATVASSAYNFGSSNAMPNLSYEVEGVVPGYSDANSIYDADPSAVFLDYLLDPVHGALAGYPGTPLVIGSSTAPLQGVANSYQAYVMSLGLLTSPYEKTQRQATDFISEILQCTNSDCRLSVGTLEILPYCDQTVSATVAGTAFSYTPNLTPVYSFTDDDYCPQKDEPPVKLRQTPQSDTFNMVNVEYNDRSNYYNQAPVPCSDLNDIALFGPRLASGLSWHQITQATVARTAGQLWLQKQLYEVNTYESAVRADYSLLEPGDYIAHNDTALGLVGQVCQITQIEDDADNQILLTARELPGVTRTTSQYNWAAAAGYFANYASDPGAVQAPSIFVMPPIPGALSEGITIGIAVCGQTANAFWLGCDVYSSVDGGTTYQFVGKVEEACRYGTLTANISAVADPDTTSTLSIALANTNLQISTSITHAEADSVQTPILVDTGVQAEIMSFGAATLTSAGHYNLSYLRRGLYGSIDQAHVTSDLFVRLDGAIFQIAMDPGYAGQTVSFKFISFNTWQQYGPQTLSGATAYSYTIPSALPVSGTLNLIPRGTCAVDGNNVYKQPNGTAGTWDSDAYSPQAFLNGCFISCRSGPTNNSQSMVGFSTSPTASVSYTSLNYAIYMATTSVQIYESGVQVLVLLNTNVTGDAYEIRYDGVTIRYFRNGGLLRAVRAAGFTLYPKVCIAQAGDVVSNVEFGPASAVNQPTGSWLNTYPWVVGSSGNQGNYIATGGGAVVLAGNSGTPLGPYGTSEPIFQTAGGFATFDGGWENSGDLYGIDTSKTYRSVVWLYWNGVGNPLFYHGADYIGGARYTCTVGTQTPVANPYFNATINVAASLAPNKWYLAVGVLHGSSYAGGSSVISGIYDPLTGQLVVPGTEFNILGGALFQMQRVYHYADTNASGLMYFAKPRFEEANGNEPSLQALMAPAAALQGFVSTGQCVVTGQTFSKQGGSIAWDSCVYSVKGYTTAHIAAKPIDSGGNSYMMGFSTNPSLSSSYVNGNFMWYQGAGTWAIYESGSSVGTYGAVSTSDLPEITYDGTTVTYLLNKVSKRTVTSVGLTVYAFAPINNPGVGWNSVNFGPTTSLAVTDTSQVRDNAVSQIVSAVRASTVTNSFHNTIADYDDLTATITTTGNPVGVDVTMEILVTAAGASSAAFNSPMTVTVTRDGSQIGTAQVNVYDYTTNTTSSGSPVVEWSMQGTLTVVDSPAAGAHTYAIHIHAASCTGGTSQTIGTTNPAIKVREYKK